MNYSHKNCLYKNKRRSNLYTYRKSKQIDIEKKHKLIFLEIEYFTSGTVKRTGNIFLDPKLKETHSISISSYSLH